MVSISAQQAENTLLVTVSGTLVQTMISRHHQAVGMKCDDVYRVLVGLFVFQIKMLLIAQPPIPMVESITLHYRSRLKWLIVPVSFRLDFDGRVEACRMCKEPRTFFRTDDLEHRDRLIKLLINRH